MSSFFPPFGYRHVRPLQQSDYVRLLEQGELPPFARDSQTMPLGDSEIALAYSHYPIVFVRDPTTGEHHTVVLLGLSPGQNLFSNSRGWDADVYVPAYVRRFPFCMATAANGSEPGGRVVCVEAQFASSSYIEGSERLFDTGEGSSGWAAIRQFLEESEADLALARDFARRLAEFELLKPLAIEAYERGQRSDLLYVSEERLAKLATRAIVALHRNGDLGRIHSHLASLGRLQALRVRALNQARALL